MKAIPTLMVCGLVALAGCSTTRTFVDYSRGSLYSTETVGNVPYVEVGPVTASQRGFFWNSCEELAEKAVIKLRATAEERGANNVIAVRWLNHGDGSYAETPICTTGWGWLLAPPVLGGFLPWLKATELQGRLVHADDATLAKLRTETGRRVAEYQKQKAAMLAAGQAAKDAGKKPDEAETARLAAEKLATEQAALDKQRADEAAAAAAIAQADADWLAAEQAAAQQASAAAAQQAAADKKAAARKAWIKKEAARKAAEKAAAEKTAAQPAAGAGR